MDTKGGYSSEVEHLLKMPFSDYEKELIRCCAQHYSEKPDEVAYTDLPRFEELGWEKVSPVLDRLIRLGPIRGFSDSSIKVLPICVELVHAWDNPPPRDRWDEATKWLRSKAWSLPLLVLAASLPLLKGWWDLITMVLGWIYPGNK
jgi:hypothetical protein